MAKKKQKKQQGGGQQFLSPEQYLRQKARSLEIGTCYVTTDIDEMRMGHVIVTRRHTGGRISMAGYLVDMACLGVKDSFYQLRMEDWEFDDFLSERRDMFRECSYEEAHNRVWGSIAYAEEAGIRPDKSFQLTQYMLEEDTDDVPLIEYEYGRDGSDDDIKTLYDLPIDHLDMADIAKAKSITGIKHLSRIMELGFDGIEDEDEMRRRYVDYILKHPEELLSRLPKNEMDVLLYILVNHDKAKGVPTANTERPLIMEIACVADSYWDDEDRFCIRVADDFQRVALPIASDVRLSDAARERYEVESIIEGMANLYGEVTLEDAKRGVMMARGGFRSEAGRLIDRVMDRSLLLNISIAKIDETKKGPFALADDNLVFTSLYCWSDTDALLKAIGKNPPMPTQPFTDDDARRFTTDEFQEAGSGEVPTIPNERQQEFWHFLTSELKWDDYYARRICFDLWYKANHADDPGNDDHETIEEYFENEALSLDGITEAQCQEGRRLLADYVAHIPRWTLKGHAPAET